jgi:hypothetical protein
LAGVESSATKDGRIPDLAPRTIDDKRARLERLRRATGRARLAAGVVVVLEAAVGIPLLVGWIHA